MCMADVLESMRNDVSRQGSLKMMTLKEFNYARSCREPVDRVWALLGLLPATLVTMIKEAKIIDYSERGKREYWRSYLAFMVILYVFDVEDFFYVIVDGIARGKNSHLPSWCVDFNKPRTYFGFSTSRKFRAGFASPADHTVIRSILHPTRDYLSILGFKIDTVSRITNVYKHPCHNPDSIGGQEFAPMYYTWLQECRALCCSTRGTLAVTGALCCTMVAADGNKDEDRRFCQAGLKFIRLWRTPSIDYLWMMITNLPRPESPTQRNISIQ